MHTYTYIYIYLHVTHKPTTKLPFEKFIYARIHIHTHICTHTYTHTYIARIHIHTHILDARANHETTFREIDICTHTYIHTYMHAYIYTHIYCTHTYTHTYIGRTSQPRTTFREILPNIRSLSMHRPPLRFVP